MNVTTRRRLGVIAAATALFAAVTACGGGGAEVQGIQIVEAGKLTVCTHLPYAPFQEKEKGSDKIVGFDVDMLDLLAKDLGVQQKVVNLGEWNQVTSGAAFEAGRCDIGMGAMTITPERQKVLAISEPYFEATQVLMVKKGAPYKSLQDLAGKRVAVQIDTTGQKYVTDQAKSIEGLTPVKYEDLVLQLNAVKAGNVEAAVSDNGPVLNYVKRNPDTEVVATFKTNEHYGFPAQKNANGEKLIDKLNAVMTKAEKDGTYNQIYKKWFGVEPGQAS